MLQRKHSSSREPKKTVKVRLMCQGRKDEVWSVASSVEVCGLKENYKRKNISQHSQEMMWMFNGREIRDDERMFEIGMKYRRENVIMIMKRNTDRTYNERECHTFNRAPIDQVTILDDEEHEAPLDNYRDFNTDLTGDEYFNNSETDEEYNDRQERFEKMKKVKETSEKRKDRQTSSVKLAEQVENYKGNLEIGEILKNIGEHNVETKHKPKKGKVKKKKSNSRKILKESPPENPEEEAMVERKQNDKKVDLNDGEVLIEQSIESTDDNLDLSSWEKVWKGSRKKPKKTGMEKKPEKGKREKYIVKSLEDSWPPLESNPSYKRTILSSRNNAASTETCPISEKNDFLFDYVGQNKKSLDESDCNANIKESKEVADCNANIKVAEEEVFSIKSEVGNQLDKTNETAKESNTAQFSISVNYQREQNVNLGSNDDISQANDSHVMKSPLMTSKIEPSRQPLPKVTNDLKSNNVLQELSPTHKTTEHKILKGNVPEVKESIDCFPKIEKDFFCPIKTCPLVSDVVPFGPQTRTINNFKKIPSSASNIKSPFGCENVSFSNAGQTENHEYGSSTDSVKLYAVVSREVTENADLTASSQVLMEDRDKVTVLREVELDAIHPNCIQEGDKTCTQSSSGSPEDSDELATLHPNRINEGEQMYTSSHDASEEHLQCRSSYGIRGQEDSEPVQARDAHGRQSVTSQPEFPLESMCPLPGLAVSQQNYLLPPVLQAENLPYDGPSKPPVTEVSISSISFGLDSAETPPDNMSSDDKTYPKNLKDLHIVEEGNFCSKLSDDPFVKPPEHLLSPLHDGQPEPGQQIVFLQPLVFFCAPQVPQLPCVPQVNVAAFSGTSQHQHAFFGASQQPDAFSGTSQQPNAFFGASQQPNAFFGASQQPQLYLPNRFSESTQAPAMLYLPPEQSSVGSPHLQTYLTAQHLP